MKKTLFVLLLPVALLCGAERKPAQQQTTQTSPATNVSAQQTAARNAAKQATGDNQLKLPPDAKKIEPFAWSWTDTNGKKWIYRKTPFGLVRSEDKPEAQPTAESKIPVTFTDQGDSIRFDRKSPFGVTTWTKKKTDLNEEEKKIVEGGQPQAAPGDKK